MGPTIDSRTKTPHAGILLPQTGYEVKTVEHISFIWIMLYHCWSCYKDLLVTPILSYTACWMLICKLLPIRQHILAMIQMNGLCQVSLLWSHSRVGVKTKESHHKSLIMLHTTIPSCFLCASIYTRPNFSWKNGAIELKSAPQHPQRFPLVGPIYNFRVRPCNNSYMLFLLIGGCRGVGVKGGVNVILNTNFWDFLNLYFFIFYWLVGLSAPVELVECKELVLEKNIHFLKLLYW